MDYRAYIIDDEGHIIGVHELNCAGDDEAKQQAGTLLDGHDLEVWHRDRRDSRPEAPHATLGPPRLAASFIDPSSACGGHIPGLQAPDPSAGRELLRVYPHAAVCGHSQSAR
jgi:hypothetical protein